MQKRSCRRTPEEKAIHDKAVSLRKMSDRKLVELVEQQYKLGQEAGLTIGKASKHNLAEIAETIILSLKTAKGVGAATVAKIEPIIRRYLRDE